MSIPTPTTYRVAALVLLVGCLVLLADRTARIELEQAVSASLHKNTALDAHISVSGD